MKKPYTRPTITVTPCPSPSLLALSTEGADQDFAKRQTFCDFDDDDEGADSGLPLTTSPSVRQAYDDYGLSH